MSKKRYPRVLSRVTVIQLSYPEIKLDKRAPITLRMPRNFNPLVENHVWSYKWAQHLDEETYAMEARYCEWDDDDYARASSSFLDNYRFEFANRSPTKGLESLFLDGYLTCKQLYELRKLCSEIEIVFEKLTHELFELYPSDMCTSIFNCIEDTEYHQMKSSEFLDTPSNRKVFQEAVDLLLTTTSEHLKHWRDLVFELFDDNQKFVRDYLMAYFAPVDYAYIGSRTLQFWDYPSWTYEDGKRLCEGDTAFYQRGCRQFLALKNCHL